MLPRMYTACWMCQKKEPKNYSSLTDIISKKLCEFSYTVFNGDTHITD